MMCIDRLVLAWGGLRLHCKTGHALRQYIAVVFSQLDTAMCVRVMGCWKLACDNARDTVRKLAKRSCWRERSIISGAFCSWRQWRVHKRTIARLLGMSWRTHLKQRVTKPLAYHWLMRKAVHGWHKVMHEEMVKNLTSTCEAMAQQLFDLREREQQHTQHTAILTRKAYVRMVRRHLSKAWASFVAAAAGARQRRITEVRAALRIVLLRLSVAFRSWVAEVHASAWDKQATARDDLLTDALRERENALSTLQSLRALRVESARCAVMRMLKAHLSASFDNFIHNVRGSRQGRKRTKQALHRKSLALYAEAFARWKEQAAEQHPTAVSLSIELDFNSTLASSSQRSSFEKQLQVDICGALGIEVERLCVLCHQKGSIVSEIVLGNPRGMPKLDSKELALALVDLVGNPDSVIFRTPLGKHMTKAIVHGPICEQTVEAQRRAREAEESLQRTKEAEERLSSVLQKSARIWATSKSRDYVSNKTIRQRQHQALGHEQC